MLFGCLIVLFMLYYFKSKELIAAKEKDSSHSETIAFLHEKISRSYAAIVAAEQKDNSYSVTVAFLQEKISISHAAIVAAEQKGNGYNETIALLQEKISMSYAAIPVLARQQFDEFKKKELDDLKNILTQSAEKSALAELEIWKVKNEAYYRQDAINRSQSVILGKVTEHLIPFQSSFPFNPKEARFIGSPIDIIVFDGIDNEDIVNIHILEIKTGSSSLSKRQRLIRDAVMNKRVHWLEISI